MEIKLYEVLELYKYNNGATYLSFIDIFYINQINERLMSEGDIITLYYNVN